MVERPSIAIGTRLSVLDRSPSGVVAVPLEALCRHLTILGTTGSGKSTCAKVVAAELGALGVPTLILDRTGEYVESLRRHAYAKVLRPGRT